MLNFRVSYHVNPDLLKAPCDRSEKIVAAQAMKDTTPFVPALTGSLSNRAHLEGANIVYPGPYARYLYAGKAMVDENGRPAFLTKDGFRFHKGAVLHATNKDLIFTKEMHAQAQAHWFDASKAQNFKKWVRVAKRSVENELRKK